jgi:integrase
VGLAYPQRVGRPSLAVGTAGRVRTYRTQQGWKARVLFRDFDGVTRDVEKNRKTRSAAERALAEALRDRVRIAGEDVITTETRVAALFKWWLEQLVDRSATTTAAYSYVGERHVIPALGSLRVRELSVGTIHRFLRSVAEHHGPATAKMCKSIMSGMCGFATRHDALERNPVRDVGPIGNGASKPPRALTAVEVRQLLAWVTYDPYAVEHDVPDLLAFLAATGCRIGEAIGLTWDRVNFDAGTVLIDRQAIRTKGHGLRLVSTKTDAGIRGLVLPRWCIDMLKERQVLNTSAGNVHSLEVSPVFPAIRTGGIRDPRNVARDLRRSLDGTGFEWVSAHTFRKTVATLMDEAGLSSRAAADQLGHAHPTVTMNTYYGRKIASTGAAAVLESLG